MPHQHLASADYKRKKKRAQEDKYSTDSDNTDNDITTVRERDPHIKDWLAELVVGAAFAYMLCNSYVAAKPNVPPAVAEYSDGWLKGEEVSENVVLDVLRKSANGEVLVADVVAAIEAKGEIMSANKVAREIYKHFKITSKVVSGVGRKSVRVYKGLALNN